MQHQTHAPDRGGGNAIILNKKYSISPAGRPTRPYIQFYMFPAWPMENMERLCVNTNFEYAELWT